MKSTGPATRDVNRPQIGTFIATITVHEPRPIYADPQNGKPLGFTLQAMLDQAVEDAGPEALVTAVTLELGEDFAKEYRTETLLNKDRNK